MSAPVTPTSVTVMLTVPTLLGVMSVPVTMDMLGMALSVLVSIYGR